MTSPAVHIARLKFIANLHVDLLHSEKTESREVLATSYRAVETASGYRVPFWRYLGASSASKSASNVREDSEHVPVFTSELRSHTIGLASDQSRASFDSTVL